MTEFMRSTDAFTWAMESDPRLRSTVVTVLLLEKSPDWDDVRDRIDLITRKLPMFRQRVVESPPPAPPRWENDPDFDLDFHIRRMAAPEPGNLAGVLEMARVAGDGGLRPGPPVVDGDADRRPRGWRCGGAVQVPSLPDRRCRRCPDRHDAFDLSELSGEHEPLPAPPKVPRPPWLSGYRDVFGYDAGLVATAMAGAITSAPKLIYNSVRHPLATVESATATAASIYRTVRPVNRTGSPLMKNRTLTRRLGVHEVPMQQLREAAHLSGGALNDGFVAGFAGGLRRYHESHGVSVGDLHLSMPISLRAEGDEMGGNRITLMRFDVPVGVVDPAARISAIHEQTGKVRRERSLPYTEWIAGALNLMPRWYIGSILRHVDFLASDVPGIPVPVFLGGARVRMQYAFGPTIGSAVNVTLLTYVDTCALGIDVDTGAIPDYDVFYECLVAGFDEVLAIAA